MEFPLHTLDNLLVGQIGVLTATFDFLWEFIVEPFVQLEDDLRLGVLTLRLSSQCLLVFAKHKLELFVSSSQEEISALQAHLAVETLSGGATEYN